MTDDWPALRGHFDAFAPLRVTFDAALARDGRDRVLRVVLPLLLTGVGAAAFHGVIRTGHAVESRHEGELAAALAYWAARWVPLEPPAPIDADIEDVAGWLDTIADRLRRDEPGWRSTAPLISDRMLDAARCAAYRDGAGRLRSAGRSAPVLLQELALAAAARYAATRNFTVLHMATGARAARVLAPWLPPDDAGAWAPLWHAAAAALIASGAALAPPRPATDGAAADWPAVRQRAIASDDEHVIKLVHAMAVQHAAGPDPVWLQAANAAVKA